MKLTNVTASVIPPEVLQAKRREREKQRQECEALKGSILSLLDDEDDQLVASEPKEKTR